ncbi:MAG: hypothetical protein HY231_06820 [Acidobacteria bacterium]|nr:hypothetical protein [Acidobacteriota bacterium]
MLGAAFVTSETQSAWAGVKDSGEVMLDALLMTYVSAPLGTTGSAVWTPDLPYAVSFGLRSLANPDIRLRARVSPSQEAINSQSKQLQSERLSEILRVFPRRHQDESFSVGTGTPGLAEHTLFYGLYKPVLRFKGNGKSAQFRFVDAEGSFAYVAEGVRASFSPDTASSMIRQYVFDRAALVEPRFLSVHTTDGGPLVLVRKAERGAPDDITTTVTASIIGQNGFASDTLKQAFAVGSNLEVTYYSAEESQGYITKFEAGLDRVSPGLNQIFWDRIFKAFVIIDSSS